MHRQALNGRFSESNFDKHTEKIKVRLFTDPRPARWGPRSLKSVQCSIELIWPFYPSSGRETGKKCDHPIIILTLRSLILTYQGFHEMTIEGKSIPLEKTLGGG